MEALLASVKVWWTTYTLYIRLALMGIVLVGTAYFSAHWATLIERSSWEAKEAKRTSVVMTEYKASVDVSQDAGAKYEKKAAAIRHVVSQPDQKLDHEMQTAAGDVIIPGDLGVRLNAIASAGASETGEAASEPAAGVRSTSPVSDGERAASGVEAASGDQYRIGDRLPLAPQGTR